MMPVHAKWLAVAIGLFLFCVLVFGAAWLGLCMVMLDVKDPFSKVTIVYVKKNIESNVAIKAENVEERDFTACLSPFIYTPYQHAKDVIGHYSFQQLDVGEVVSKLGNLTSEPIKFPRYIE